MTMYRVDLWIIPQTLTKLGADVFGKTHTCLLVSGWASSIDGAHKQLLISEPYAQEQFALYTDLATASPMFKAIHELDGSFSVPTNAVNHYDPVWRTK